LEFESRKYSVCFFLVLYSLIFLQENLYDERKFNIKNMACNIYELFKLRLSIKNVVKIFLLFQINYLSKIRARGIVVTAAKARR
jgi:hypothetical protein